jgi:hypothetical protein
MVKTMPAHGPASCPCRGPLEMWVWGTDYVAYTLSRTHFHMPSPRTKSLVGGSGIPLRFGNSALDLSGSLSYPIKIDGFWKARL